MISWSVSLRTDCSAQVYRRSHGIGWWSFGCWARAQSSEIERFEILACVDEHIWTDDWSISVRRRWIVSESWFNFSTSVERLQRTASSVLVATSRNGRELATLPPPFLSIIWTLDTPSRGACFGCISDSFTGVTRCGIYCKSLSWVDISSAQPVRVVCPCWHSCSFVK